MIWQTISDIVTPELEKDAIYNDRFEGFHDDYLVLHCLIKKYEPKRIMEFGCNTGFGTKIICNAAGKEADVVSFDLPTDECHISLKEHGDIVGNECDLPFTLVRGNSYTFDFSTLGSFDFCYVDSDHNYEVPFIEAKASIKMQANVIVFHDSDITCVYEAIEDAFKNEDYKVYRVIGTRISYAIKN